jgi:2-polyprenyl-3-methyl-5-hydroxy-6-metoxy-1,4-benzoquinol methylase
MSELIHKCLLCSGNRLLKDEYATKSLNLSQQHGVTFCKDCGLRFLNPRPSKEEYKSFYKDNSGPLIDIYPLNKKYYADEDLLRMNEYKNKLKKLSRLGVGKKLLEIGSCTGKFLHEARNYGFEIEGIEPNYENCKIAKELYGIDLRVGDVDDQDIQENSFDVIFCSHVFEHLLDPLRIVRLMYKWLRIDGFIVIEVPNQFESFAAKRKRWLHLDRPQERSFLSIHHAIFFAPRTIRKLMALSGFQTCRIRNVYYYSNIKIWEYPLRLAARLLNPLLGGSGMIEIIAKKPRE